MVEAALGLPTITGGLSTREFLTKSLLPTSRQDLTEYMAVGVAAGVDPLGAALGTALRGLSLRPGLTEAAARDIAMLVRINVVVLFFGLFRFRVSKEYPNELFLLLIAGFLESYDGHSIDS
jgi:hypothetical protein